MSDIVLKLENISKIYPRYRKHRESLKEAITNSFARLSDKSHHSPEDGFMALDSISFELQRGQSLGIIGNNGAGKSTLLKIISEISEPSRGRMHIQGQIASILELGAGFLQELTGEENIYTYGMLLGFNRRQIRAKEEEIIAFSELEGFMQTPLKHYSSGMVMRLAFSIIVHLNHDIMLLDEALTVGDVRFREKCANKILSLKNEGKTFLLVSHNYEEISTLCNRMILLDKGRIVADGEPGEVYEKYFRQHTGPEAEEEQEERSKEKYLRLVQEKQKKLIYTNSFQDEEYVGTSSIRFQQMRVYSAINPNSRPLPATYPIVIEIGLDILAEFDTKNFGISLKDIVGYTFLAELLGNNPLIAPHKPGSYKIRWEIPRCTLNDGFFNMDIWLFNQFQKVVFTKQDVLCFEVIGPDREKRMDFIEYTVPLRPDYKVKVEIIDD